MKERFESAARRYHAEIDLTVTDAPEGHTDFQMYRCASTRLLYDGWRIHAEEMAKLEACLVGKEAAEAVELSDERIDYIADLVVKGMPDGIQGFLKSWGWRQFARAILADCAGHVAEPPIQRFAIVKDRHYEGAGLSLAVWTGPNYEFSDGDCFDRDGDTLDGYTAEFLTHAQLEQRLCAAPDFDGAICVSPEVFERLPRTRITAEQLAKAMHEAGAGKPQEETA